MAFHSLKFLIFFAAAATVYYLTPRRLRWCILLAASYLFYISSDVWAAFFLVGSTASTYFGARLLERETLRLDRLIEDGSLSAEQKKALRRKTERRRKYWCAAILVVNLGLLAAVKYAAFAADTITAVLPISLDAPRILQPLGISFYVLQSTGYVVDVYREEYGADQNFFKYALFVGFFPQLIQGPIGRYDAMANQLTQAHDWSFDNAARGLLLMLWGFFKKIVIADALAAPVAAVFAQYTAYGGVFMFLACVAYGLQLYCDFSGGVDVARGVARFFGIELAENFNQPYFSTSIAVFWRRWHITLGQWMRDYLFYPLTLSRPFAALGKWARKKLKGNTGRVLTTSIVSVIVFLTVGLWHGGAWKFVVYGLWHGCFIAGGSLLGPWLLKRRRGLGIRDNNPVITGIKIFLTFCVVSIGYYFFRADSLRTALAMLKRSVTHPLVHQLFDGSFSGLGLGAASAVIVAAGLLLVLAVGLLREKGRDIFTWLLNKPWAFQLALIAALLAVTLYYGMFSDYIASEYIYMNF